MFGIVDRYVGRTVLSIILISLIVLSLLTLLISFIDMTRHLGKGDIDFVFLLKYVSLILPSKLNYLFPISVLLGGVLGLGVMAKNSELVILQACGMSKTRIILSSFKIVLPVILVVSLASQTIFPQLKQYADNQFNFYSSEGRVSRTSWGIWVREGNSFISIRRVMSDSSIHEISRYDFDDMQLKQISNAQMGLYKDGRWEMHNINNFVYTDYAIQKSHSDIEYWDLYLNPERIEIFNFSNSELNVPALLDYINYLEENNIDASRYRTTLYKLLFAPVAMIIMLLLGASTVFGSQRSVNMSVRVLIGLSFGFGFYICNEVMPNFTLVLGLPPLVGVMLPMVLFASISLYLLNRRT